MKAHLTPTQVREYLSRLRNEGVSESTILEKLESLEQYVLFLKKKNLLADDTVNTIKSILQEYRYSHTEDILESEPSVVKTNTVPKIHQFESASYAGNKKTESLAGEVHVQFHFETYKISSWLFDKLKNTPIIGRLMNAGKQNPQKTPLESTFSLSKLSVEHYIGFIILLIFTAGLGAGLYNNFFKKTATPFAYPSTLTRGGRVISFQGRLTDTLGNPITTQTDVSFKLYSVSSGGSPLYTGSCTGVSGVSPDQDGIFDVLVGSDCSMSEISNSVFTENTNVFLGVTVGSDSEMTPRQQIANVGYAINAETLQGLPPGTETSSIPYINNQGNVLIAASNPGVRSIYSSATFTLSGANAVTLQSAGTGDVVVQATESGSLKLRTGGTTDANTRLIVTNNGNVGIGLTNPANMLAVAGGLGIGNTYAYVTAPTNGAIIQGNVGLGTTAPVEALDLNGRLRIQQTSSPVSPTDKLYNVAGDLYWSGNLVWNGANDGSGSGLDADFFDGLDSGSFLRSDTSDQFTSGTLTFNSGTTLDTNSGSTLDVNGDIAIADTNIALDGASTNLNATGNFSINTNDLFVKKSDGNVGIGTTNPGQLLDVIGGSIRTDNQFISTITTGTAPLSITSTTLVTNLNADMVDGYHASQLCKSDGSDCQSLASAGGWTDGGTAVYLTTNTDKVGIGTTAPGSKLSIAGGVGIGTTSSSSVYHSTSAPDGGLIIEGSLGLGTTNPSEKLHVVGNTIVTGTSDLQGTIANSAGNLVLGDTTDIGSATTGIRISTTGSISDIDAGIQLNDAVDVTGAISNSTGSILIDDQADIGSASNGLRINVDGNLSDINGNIVLNDIVDIGSETTGINVTAAGLITDIDGNVVIADVLDLGSATNGINITTNGIISDSDGNISLNDNTDVTGNITLTGTFSDSNSDIQINDNLDPNTDATFDLGDATTSWRDLYLTGQICFDDTDCFSTAAGSNSGWYDDGTVVRLLTQTDKVGIGTTNPGSKLSISGGVGIGTTASASVFHSGVAPDGGLIVEGNVGIGLTGPTAKLHVSGTAIITSTLDQQGTISNSTGNVVIDDTVDLGSSTNGLRVDTAGNVIDINGNIVLNDTVDIGSATNGLNITTSGTISDIDDVITLNDAVQITGILSDSDSNLILADTVDIGSATTGVNITTAGALSDIDGTLQLNDAVDITGVLSDSNSDLTIDDNVDPNADATYDLGDVTTSWRNFYLTGQICFDDSDCFSSSPSNQSGWTDDGTVVRLTTVTDKVGIGTTNPGSKLSVSGGVGIGTTASASVFHSGVAPDGGLIVEGNVGIGLTGPTAKLHVSGNEIITGTSDIQTSVANSTGNLLLDDTTDIGSSANGLRIDTAGNIVDINGNIVLNDTVDIGSAANGINITTSGVITDSNADVTFGDHVDPETDATYDLGDTTTSWRNIYLTGNICFDDSDCFSSTSGIGGGGWTDGGSNVYLVTQTDKVGIGTSVPGSKLSVSGGVGIGTTSPSSVFYTASAPDGGLIVEGNVGIGLTGPTAKLHISGTAIITSTLDQQGTIANSTGNLVLNDIADIGSATTGINITAAGLITDTDGNVIIGDTVDLGSASTGVNITTAGAITDTDANLVLDDTVDIGSAANGIRIDTAGSIIDINGTLQLNDTVDITGQVSDSDSDLQINDNLDPASDAALDLGDTTTSWRDLYLTGQICFDDTNCFNNSPTNVTGWTDNGSTVILTTVTDKVGIGTTNPGSKLSVSGGVGIGTTASASVFHSGVAPDGGLIVEGNVGIGLTGPTAKLHVSGNEIITGTSDIQTSVANSTGNLLLDDTTDIGSSANGLRIDTAGNIVDINGNIVLNDTVDIGSASTGVNITTTGIISDSDGNLSLSDNTDVTGNLTLTGTFSDSNSDIQVNDNLDPNTDAAFDLGDTTTSWRDLYLTGQICFDDSDCTSSFATSFVQLQGSTPGTQQTGNLNVSGTAITGITQTGYIVDTSNTAYGLDPAGTSNFGGYSLKITGGGLLAYDAGNVGIGNTSPQSKLTVRGGVSIGSTAAGSVFKTAVAPDGGLIVEKTIGVGTTSPDSTYELTLSGNDSFVGGYITNKLTGSINTAGLRLDRGDQANGYALNYYHTAGTEVWQLGMRAGNDTYVIRYQDTSNRLTIDTSGNVSLGSDSTGLQINSAGVLSDINGNLSLNDNTDITGTLTVSGNISDPDSDLTINDDVIPQTDNLNNIGSTNNSWLDFYLTGQICFDDTNCFNNSPTNVTGWTDNGSTVILTTVTDKVGIGNTNPASALSVRGGAGIGSTASGSIFKSAVAPDGGLIVEGNVGIGTTAPTAALDMNTGRILSAYNSGLAGIDDASLYLASGNPFIGFLDTGNSNGWMIGSNASGAFEFWAGTESSVTVPSVTFTSAGNVGIATTAPSEKLDVNGNVEINASVTTYTQRLCHNGANQATTNMKLGDCASAGQADLAEMYRTVGEIEPGDIVAPDEKGNAIVRKTTKSYSDNMIGIVSTNPLVDTILGARMAEKDNSVQPIALVGRIPLKVSLENGPISIGDNLTSSSIPGVAMKAKKSGRIIATALENYDGTTKMTPMVIQDENNRAIDHKSDLPLYKSVPSKWPSNVGKIMVFANLSWHNTPNETELSNPLTVQKINSNLVKISELLTTTLQTVSATFDTVTISTLNSVISNFNKITAQTLSALDGTLERLNVTEKINTPIVETNTLVVKNTANIKKIETETIDSQGTDLTVILGSETTPESQTEKGKLARVIIKGLEGKTVASIDARGNASFSGTVTAKDASVSGTLDAGAVLADSLQSDEASISGTLNAREVRADNITALENRVNAIASSSGSPRNDEEIANLNTSINDIQQLLNEIKNQPLANPNYYQNIDNNTQIPVSTASADLLISDVEDISFENLTVSGRSSLYDVSVANSVAVGSTLIEDGSILALTWELKFAALNQVSFFDDNVVIAKNGTITTQGTLVAKGGVHTNEIKPINKNDDVNVILASNASLESQVQGAGRSSMKNSKLAIRNEQGHEVASIDASGSARFKEIALDKYLEATNSGALIAASQNFYDNGIYAPAIETNANIAGVGLLPANNSELVIYNDKVKKDSLIYVTAASSTFDKNLYVATKVECALNQPECKPHFRVAITGPLPQDVKFNWWIVN